MKILSAQQIREADAATIADEHISSDQLMERASLVFTHWLLKNFSPTGTTRIFCGTGNNGGDGLCVARHLFLKGYTVQVITIGDQSAAGKDFTINYQRLIKHGLLNLIAFDDETQLSIGEDEIIIDAIFGTGLNRAPEGIHSKAIELINHSNAMVIAIDMPSGLFADSVSPGPVIEADFTLSFELPKLSFFFPENANYTGDWEVMSIGLSDRFIESADTNYIYLSEDEILPFIKDRKTFEHKGSFGHSLIIAGNPGTAGAAELCAYACLITGSGLVTICSGQDNAEFPELMTVSRNEVINKIKENKYTAIGIGPGLGIESGELLEKVISTHHGPLVIDADALNIIAGNKELLSMLPPNSILTPHPKEFERLFGTSVNEEERLKKQIGMSVQFRSIIVFKRAYTVITLPDGRVFFNSTGNPGMATAGSGDVLTGVITALLAQKYLPDQAALAAVYLHGLAGDIAMLESGGNSLVAGDLIDHIPTAFEFLKSI